MFLDIVNLYPALVDVRRAVLDAAIEIITTDGPDQVSMREVARRAGVSHQAPYHYFTDRAGIFAAISEEGFREFTAEFRNALDGSSDPLVDCLRSYVRFALAHKGHFKVMFRSDICAIATHQATREAADNAYLALLDLAATAGNGSATADAVTLPVLLWSQAHGLATLLVDGPLAAKLPPELAINDLVDAVARAAAGQMAHTAESRTAQPERPKKS